MPELLLELFSEEIPARMQDGAAADLRRLVLASLDAAGLAHGDAAAFATPRRLCLVVDGLEAGQPDRAIERRGPRVDAPDAARQGFLRGLGTGDYELGEQADRKGTFLLARFVQKGRRTADLLAEALPGILASFPWPKSMRWGEGDARWVRPLQGIVCLFDGEVVPFTFAGVESGRTTRGHCFMAPTPFEVETFAGYRDRLREASVMLDGDERRRTISRRAQILAAGQGLEVRPDPALLDELKGLAEWPVPLLGRIDDAFMTLPPEVLVTSMRAHQKYLALQDSDAALAPFFIAVANVETADGGAAIVAGNERVLRARLWDARFFWEKDRETPLEGRVAALDRMVFHADLGTVGDKVKRLIPLAFWLASHTNALDPQEVERAALLAKADLVTGMVGEFPELQGLMGAYYAEAQGEAPAVVRAIREHYRPLGPNDACPATPESVALALADKLDTLAGFFGIGVKPTGAGDPFALRRAALGVIRLVLENGVRLPLKEAVHFARRAYGERLAGRDEPSLCDDLLDFFVDRLRVHLKGEGVRGDLLAAVLATGRDDDLVRLIARTRALAAFVASDDGRNLLAGHRRACNILAIEEKRDGRAYAGDVDGGLFQLEAERALRTALIDAEPVVADALERERYDEAMGALAALRPAVDAFFDGVLVNADEPGLRRNRLELLARLRVAFAPVADFGTIEDASGRA
ncbi:MAG: glycine--tRNA ligase subunit beta [Geminicoccaceae bacterium]|nr:glycine--tRNA ligase subunit beta [Geminicoccaceae bacterium]